MKQNEEDDGAMHSRGKMLVDTISLALDIFFKKTKSCFWILLLMGCCRNEEIGDFFCVFSFTLHTGFHTVMSESLLKLDQHSLSNLGHFLVNQFCFYIPVLLSFSKIR